MLGVGDSFAAIIGKQFGKHKIFKTDKTYEGLLGCFLSMIIYNLYLFNNYHV